MKKDRFTKNLQKKTEEQLLEIWNQKEDFPHTFSPAYCEKKESLLQSMDSQKYRHKRKLRTFYRLAIATIFAALLIPSTGYAAFRLYKSYHMKSENVENYQVNVIMEKEENSTDVTIPNRKMKIEYVPEGMTFSQNSSAPGLMKYNTSDGMAGITFILFRMDCTDTSVLEKTYVTSSSEMNINGHKAIYLEFDDTAMNVLYLYFSEEQHIVAIHLANSLNQEEVQKIAAGVSLEESDTSEAASWSEYLAHHTDSEPAYSSHHSDSANKKDLKVHQIGDSIPTTDIFGNEVTYRIDQVEILDNGNKLNMQTMNSLVQKQFDQEGNLIPNTIQYMKDGDGIKTLPEVLDTKIINQKLVYVTFTLQNPTDMDYTDLDIYSSLAFLKEEEDEYHIIYRKNDLACDYIKCSGQDSIFPIFYQLDEKPENYYEDLSHADNTIASLKAGEESTFHMAFIADEDLLNNMFLCLQGFNEEFIPQSNSDLDHDFVDIRQSYK